MDNVSEPAPLEIFYLNNSLSIHTTPTITAEMRLFLTKFGGHIFDDVKILSPLSGSLPVISICCLWHQVCARILH
ncbi:MAG: hypothetical protein RL417_436 [Pseudomonadota bacterium]|jgi:hypothetical protein